MQRRGFLSAGIFAGLSIADFPEGFAQFVDGEKPRAITNKIKRSPLKPLYVPPTDAAQFGPVTKMKFGDTGNQFSVVENSIAARTMGPAPHVHKELDEYMRVIKGTVTVLVGDETLEVKEGGWHLRPHGIVHTFWNAGNEPATFIDFYPNQNFDLFLEEMMKMFEELGQQGIGPASKEAQRRLDLLHEEWGVVMYHGQREGLRKKYGLT